MGTATKFTVEDFYAAAVEARGNLQVAADSLGVTRSTLQGKLRRADKINSLRQHFALRKSSSAREEVSTSNKVKVRQVGNLIELVYVGEKILEPEQLIAQSKIDMALFEIERIITNFWEQAGKLEKTLYKTDLRQIKVILRRKKDEQVATERLLAQLSKRGPIRAKFKVPKLSKQQKRRALEISIMDPHLGMLCFQGESDHSWDLNKCASLCMWSIEKLLDRAKPYGDFDEIVFPFGNDFMHHDNLNHTTTKGTLQPEGVSYAYVYERAIELGIAMVDRLAKIAPVKVIQVSGNHDQVSSFSLGHVLKAYYRRDAGVDVQVNPSPYKFWRYGVNLVGFDHGHHVKPIRLAALMAHEAKEHWVDTCYREWHLGDQHRKGSSSPVTMEEQGVSVEYLPALTPPNAWHRLKAFNWQQRGAMAFVWDRAEGPIARLQVNINSYTGRPAGK